jgi:hypothetical protein
VSFATGFTLIWYQLMKIELLDWLGWNAFRFILNAPSILLKTHFKAITQHLKPVNIDRFFYKLRLSSSSKLKQVPWAISGPIFNANFIQPFLQAYCGEYCKHLPVPFL